MVRLWFLRIAGAIGILSIVFLLVSLDPFLAAAPLAGLARTPQVTVDRSLKGDLLPLFNAGIARSNGARPAELGAKERSQQREQIPVGCDPAFSPVSSPALAKIYGRCMT